MPRRRTKSVNDIYYQYRRILDENVRRGGGLPEGSIERRRADRALNAFNQYIGNIGQRSRSMQRNWDGNKQFSRRTYMGLANG